MLKHVLFTIRELKFINSYTKLSCGMKYIITRTGNSVALTTKTCNNSLFRNILNFVKLFGAQPR